MAKLAAATFARHVTWLYQKDLPGDRGRLFKVFALLEGYSRISSIDVERHLKYIRDKAFNSFPYPSIGRWRFMDFYITELPEYPDIISRLKDGDALLDVGCCFGHILRQIVFDGAPSDNLAGTDLRPEFIELGYELFRDRDTFEAKFVTGDILDANNAGLATLDGDFDIIHAAAFFHLFDWSTQVKIGERLVRFFKPGTSNALLVGRQIGSRQPLRVEQSEKRGEKIPPRCSQHTLRRRPSGSPDPEIVLPKHRQLSQQVIEYVRNGGTAVIGGFFTRFLRPDDLNRWLRDAWNLPWEFGQYERTTVIFQNSASGRPHSH
ncbi:hypothetical protein VSDG_07237 [Cytospora chrysosperma]|uniref:Methyltransferase domain-containing protein n=1 Tax=Cytospora chrysosperma TaxID=252740 RepID=A0A423VMP3_CYTCH|nr:hypothetical protein VSDG_07237 [Valsa sordida]